MLKHVASPIKVMFEFCYCGHFLTRNAKKYVMGRSDNVQTKETAFHFGFMKPGHMCALFKRTVTNV
jgi:hypothetical protein